MCNDIIRFTQKEYARVLDTHRVRNMGFGQRVCESILVEHGASQEQAKTGRTFPYTTPNTWP